MCRDQEKKGAFVAWVAAETRKENENRLRVRLGFKAWWTCVCVRPDRKQRRKIIKGPFGGNWGLSERFDVFVCE